MKIRISAEHLACDDCNLENAVDMDEISDVPYIWAINDDILVVANEEHFAFVVEKVEGNEVANAEVKMMVVDCDLMPLNHERIDELIGAGIAIYTNINVEADNMDGELINLTYEDFQSGKFMATFLDNSGAGTWQFIGTTNVIETYGLDNFDDDEETESTGIRKEFEEGMMEVLNDSDDLVTIQNWIMKNAETKEMSSDELLVIIDTFINREG